MTDLRIRCPRHECLAAEARIIARAADRCADEQTRNALRESAFRVAAHAEQMQAEAEAAAEARGRPGMFARVVRLRPALALIEGGHTQP